MGVVKLLFGALLVLVLTGCAGGVGGPDSNKTSAVGSCVKEGATALFEDPNMEKQVNRVATATGILKLNNIMLYQMPISADAKWVDVVVNDVTPAQKELVMKKLSDDPYFGTVFFTNTFNNNMMALFSRLTPMETYLYGTLETLYDAYPEIYELSASVESLQSFKGGKLKAITAVSGDKYENIEAAILSLVPTNDKKTLEASIRDYKKAISDVAKEKDNLGLLEKDNASKKANAEKIEVSKAKIVELEKAADEKEKIMDVAWKDAVVNLDTNINDKKMALVRKIKLVLEAVDNGAIMATCTYITAGAKTYTSLNKLQDELNRLGVATAVSTANPKMGTLMKKRVERLGKNAIMAIPNIFVGSYLIVKQQLFVSKYNDVINKIVKADDDRRKVLEEKNKAQADAKKPEVKTEQKDK